MNYENFFTQIGAHASLDEAQSEEAARAVLRVLSKLLPVALRHDLRATLPATLAEVLAEPVVATSFSDSDEFFTAVANTEHLPVGFAKEHTGVVCEALVEILPAENVRRIIAAVGPELGPLFHRREHFRAPPRPVHDIRETISSGRSGGATPLSEAGGDDRKDTLASGQPGGKSPLNEAHPGHRDERGE